MRRILLLGALICSSLILTCQNDPLAERAAELLETYEKHYLADRHLVARQYLDKGLALLRGQRRDTLLGTFYNLYTYWYFQKGQMEKALHAQGRAAELFERGYGPADPTAFAFHNLAYLQARVAGQPDSAVHYYHRGRHIYEKLDRPIDVADEWRNIGLIHYGQNNYAQARSAYRSAVSVLDELIPTSVAEHYPKQEEAYLQTLSWLYLNLADLANEEEDLRQVRIYLQYARDLLLPYGEKYPLLAREVREDEARIHGYLKDGERSLQVYGALLESTDSLKEARFYQRILASMAQVASEVEQDYAVALRYWKRLLVNNDRSGMATSLNLTRYHREMARCNLELARWPAAEKHLDLADRYLDRNPQNQERGILFFLRAYLAHLRHQPQLALELLSAARSVHDFPSSVTRAGQERLAGEVYFHKYKIGGAMADLEAAEQWTRTSFRTLTAFEETTFKRRSFGPEYRKTIGLLLRCLLERFPKDPTIAGEVFALLEQSKGYSLRRGHYWEHQRRVRQNDEQAAQFVELERTRLRLLDRRQAIDAADTSGLLALSDSLVVLNQHWEALRQTLPGPNLEIAANADLKAVQVALPVGTALVNYFLEDSIFVALAITREGAVIHHQRPEADWSASIESLIEAVSQPQSSAHLAEYSYSAYRHFLAPVLAQLPTEINRLILVPDGLLTELPWPALCTALPSGEDYRRWPFLLRKYRLSYLTYAGIIPNLAADRRPAPQVAGFAPSYPAVEIVDTLAQLATLRASDFWPLPGAEREVNAIDALYGRQSDLFVDNTATREIFQREAADYSVLHLALHAVVDEYAPDASYLLFADGGELQSLTSLALLDLELQTELMVLSACYAGAGPWRAGEGAQSLAYTLRQTGVRSVLSNTWTVADQFSGKLMLGFHRQVRAGVPLDIALADAQQQYITTAESAELAHPYYWAGFRLQGSTAAFRKAGFDGWWWTGGGLILCLATALFYFLRNTKNPD